MNAWELNKLSAQTAATGYSQQRAVGPGVQSRRRGSATSSISNRDSSPSGSSYACSVPTLSGHSSPRAQSGSPEPSGLAGFWSQAPRTQPYLLDYEPNGRSLRNFMRVDKFNAKSIEGHQNPNMNNAATPVAFSREPTPPAPLLPHGHYYLAPPPQPAQSGSASPQTYPTPRASYTPSVGRGGSASPLSGSEAVYRSYRAPASPYASATTYSGSASPSHSTSRANSASLTPEPEQHFQCPDCSRFFGSRDVLNMHLRGQYYNGHCPAHH